MRLLDPNLLPRDFEPYHSDYLLLKQLPPRPVEIVAQLAIIVHLPPAVTAPFATCHVHDEIAIYLIIMYSSIVPIIRTGSRWKTVDFSLLNEGGMWSDP